MRLRYWILTLADLMVIIHVVFLSLLVVYHQEIGSLSWMYSKKVPAAFYIAINITPIVLSTFLYVGIFRLSTRLLIIWGFAMVLLCHIPAVLIFFILCLDREVDAHLRKQRILAPSVFLCIWMLLIVNVFTFYSELKKFKKNPRFLRTSAVLAKKMNEFLELQENHPGKILVPVDSGFHK